MDKESRALAIEAAAYDVLAEKGFKGTSMLAVARAAKASNETLYRWYGDKIGLFSAMIARNAAQVEEELAAARAQGGDGVTALRAVGPALLGMVTSDKAVALNRAAAADATGTLGAALAEGGRARIAPILGALMVEIYGEEVPLGHHVEVYIALLIGDLQIRRAIGVLPPLSEAQIQTRAARALAHFTALYPP